MNRQEVIKEMYSHGWNPELVKFLEIEDGIKVKGGLTRMNWGCVKFEFYCLGYSYDQTKKVFVKTHEVKQR